MYRPIGWNNTYRDDNMMGCACRGAYEAGADAMLQGLALEGSIRTKGDDPLVTITLPNIKNGTWVFIPDAL